MCQLPWDTSSDDYTRSLLKPTEYSYVDGKLCLSVAGLDRLCQLVIDRKISGNRTNAVLLQEQLHKEFPQHLNP